MSRLDRVLIAAVCLGASHFAAFADEPVLESRKTVTLVVAFDESAAQPRVVDAMKSELAEIWKGEAVKLDWRPLESLKPGESFPSDLVVVHFKGDCHLHPINPFLIDERGPQGPAPLAYSPTVNGEVQPFSAVLCDRVNRSVSSAIAPNQRKTGDLLYGRALGRVVSHELYHILNQTRDHEREGLAKKSLTGQQLIAPSFHFSDATTHSGQ
jgi:hypothetical protein